MQSIIIGLFFAITYLLIPYKKIDERLQPSVDWVMKIVNEECPKKNYNWPPKIEISIVDDPGNGYAGVCKIAPSIFVIHVQLYIYEMMNDDVLKQLMAHELIHCLFYQDHVKRDGDLMNPSLQLYIYPSTEEQLRYFAKKSCQKN